MEYVDLQDVTYQPKEKTIILKLINVKETLKINKLGNSNKSEGIFFIIRKMFEFHNPTYAELSSFVEPVSTWSSTTEKKEEIFKCCVKYKSEYFIKEIHLDSLLLSIHDVQSVKSEKSFPLNHFTSITLSSRPHHLILR
jgi:rRNA maturation protein Rpf1